jgi:hypothetical protein
LARAKKAEKALAAANKDVSNGIRL